MTSTPGSSHEPDSRQRARVARDGNTGLLIGALLIVGAFARYAWVATESLAVRDWPAVDGVVVDTSVEQRFTYTSAGRRARQVDIHEPIITYRYAVEGRPIIGRRVWFNDRTWNTAEKAQRVLDEYPKGAAVRVHYDPEAPDQAYLVANLPPWHIFLLAILGACIAGWSLMMRRAVARTRPHGDVRPPDLGGQKPGSPPGPPPGTPTGP